MDTNTPALHPIAKSISLKMWRAAGEPEKDSEPTSVGRTWYEDRAQEVVTALLAHGYKITKPRAKVSA